MFFRDVSLLGSATDMPIRRTAGVNKEISVAIAYRAPLSRSQFFGNIQLHAVSPYGTQKVGFETAK